MSVLHRVGVIVFVAALVFFSLLAETVRAADVGLTEKERAWLAANQNKLVLWYDRKFPPIEFESEAGDFLGMAADVMGMIESRLGVSFERFPAPDWTGLLQALEGGEAAVAPVIHKTEERARYAYFSDPYVSIPVVLITARDRPTARTLKDFNGQRVAAVRGYVTEGFLREFYSQSFEIVPVDSVQEGLRDVAFGVVDAMIENLAVAAYYIEEQGLPNLRVAGDTGFSYELRFAVSREYPLLFSAMHKALGVIADEDIKALQDRWLPLGYDRGLSQEQMRRFRVGGIFLGALVVCLGLISFLLRRRLRASDERYRAIFTNAPVGIFRTTVSGKPVEVNPAMARMFGYAGRDEFLEQVRDLATDIYPTQEDRRRLLDTLDASPDGVSLEVEFKRKYGSYFQAIINASLEKDVRGSPTFIDGSIKDISFRKRAEASLRASEEKFSRLFQLSPDAILLVHLHTEVIRDANEAFFRLCGYGPEECLGSTIRELDIYPASGDRELIFHRLRAGESVNNLEIKARRKGGEIIQCSVASLVLPIDGEPHILTVIRDITETKKMQEMMIQSEKMVSVGGIAAGIAHEINNPLGIILQAAQNLATRTRTDFSKNVEAAEAVGLNLALLEAYMQRRKLDVFIADIQSAALRAASIVRHMLDFTRRSESVRTVCDLGAIIQRALTLAQSDYDLKKTYDFKRIDVRLEIDPDLPRVGCTETEIEQVLLNLMRNAAQAMHEIQPPLENPRITVRAAVEADAVRIEVEDNGPGVPEKVLPRIFEPFFTTKAPGQGTGLGLSVSYFIITKSHGGRMRVESSPGAGTRFIIDLPLTTTSKEAS
jgi:PAS domain S-box-containing protein